MNKKTSSVGDFEARFHDVVDLAEVEVRLQHLDLQGLDHCRRGGAVQTERSSGEHAGRNCRFLLIPTPFLHFELLKCGSSAFLGTSAANSDARQKEHQNHWFFLHLKQQKHSE